MKNKFKIIDKNLDKQENLELKIDINLNKLKLTLQSKNKDMRLFDIYSDSFEIDAETNMNKLIYNFYNKYIELKSIELFWIKYFNENVNVIEIPKI